MRALGLLLVGTLACACKDRSADPPARAPEPTTGGAGTAAAPTSGSSGAARAPAAPQLPAEALAAELAAEPEDAAWAKATAAQIAEVVPRATDIECRRQQCAFTLTGSERELMTATDELEREESLRGIAQSVLLTAPQIGADGTIAIRIYARFER
jgi:hypothetical protein